MLSEARAADRRKMAELLAEAVLDAGAESVAIERCDYGPRRLDVHITAPGGAKIHVDFDGRSPQPNVHVAT